MQDGRLLAELRQHYLDNLSDYREWTDAHGYPEGEALLNYRRALIGWYESQLNEGHRYTGDVLDYLTTVAGRYFPGHTEEEVDFPLGDSPLDHLPESINLDARGRELLAQLKADRECLDLLLLTDYHEMEPAVVARALDLESELEELPERTRACRYALESGVTGGAILYPKAIRVAGRQDLMETLGRSEPEEVADPAPAAPPRSEETVRLSPRRRWKVKAPSAGIVVAGLLFGVLLYLLYDTFSAGRSPEGLFTEYFEPYPDIFAGSPPTTADERDLERILYYYNRGEYQAAYEELLPTADAYPAAPLYLGVSALELGDPARAREWLDRVDPRGPYAGAAEWYRALALLAAGERSRSLGLLRGIAGEPSHPYVDRARELVDAL